MKLVYTPVLETGAFKLAGSSPAEGKAQKKKRKMLGSLLRKGGRVVECNGFENRRRATYRGFESLPFRFAFYFAFYILHIVFAFYILHMVYSYQRETSKVINEYRTFITD